MFAIFLSAALAGEPFLPDELLSRVKEEYGRGAERSLIRWQNFIIKNADQSEKRKLELVNLYFNVIPYASDLKQWGVNDYWATPVELLVHDRGDCEDYAIAKYFTLKKLGVAAEKLRVVYVHVDERTRRTRAGNGLNDGFAHMVLGYYETPTSSPLILDNLTRAIKPASERPDLKPVYTLASDDLILSMIRKRGADVRYRGGSKQWYDFMLRI
jgi:predicted transglutaminase-like cysteine proteinase